MKERLTGAIILVVLIVLLVPELLSGPKGPGLAAPAGSAAATSAEDAPLRSYTINLGDDSRAHGVANTASGPAMPQSAQPQPDAADNNSAAATSAADAASNAQGGNSGQAPGTVANSAAAGAVTQPPQQTSSQMPPAVAAAPPASQEHAATARAPAESRAAKPASATNTRPAAPAAAARNPAPAPKPAAAAARPHPAPAATEPGWGVQLGVFSSRDNAEKLASDVRSKGFKASVAPITTGGRKLYRVRVGPTADRSAAQALQGRLKAAGRSGGAVVPYT